MTRLKKHLVFDTEIGSTKPVNVSKPYVECPFCSDQELEDRIIVRNGTIVLVKNKYPVLHEAFQTVLIETEDCNSELSLYPKDHLYKLISFGVEQWQEMISSGLYKSVIFFKNHGPYSGGTVRHPHMQIVGLQNIDYTVNISSESLCGDIICQEEGVELNLSNQPQIGFFEFNIRLNNMAKINVLADYLQMTVHYVLNYFHKNCNSYNVFFYQINGEISAKIMPRFVMSPLFVGYAIPQVSSRAEDVINEIKTIYLNK